MRFCSWTMAPHDPAYVHPPRLLFLSAGLGMLTTPLTATRRERVRSATIRETPPLSWDAMPPTVTVTSYTHSGVATSNRGLDLPGANIMRLQRPSRSE